ncbi:MAG: tetratricopeptide repeat protein, partial [Verrucomicrobia bacterium]|nr:tetratricopeptide repeat protein [Verrucomicrobiota bacterium]
MRPRENGFAPGDVPPIAALGPARPERSRGNSARTARLLLTALCPLLLCSGGASPTALAAPPPAAAGAGAGRSAAAKPTPAPAPTAAAPAPPSSSSPVPAVAPSRNGSNNNGERAVIFDPAPRPAAKDLQLALESERKAEALAHYVRGLLLEESAGSDDALKEFLRAIALDPANAELALKLAGDYYLRRGEVPEAIDLLKDAIKASPRLPQPCLALSQIYLRYLHKPDQALKYAQMALDLDPTNAFAYQYLAETYVTLDQLPKAQALMDRAVKVETNDPAFWMRLANVYLALNFKDEKPRTPDDLRKANVFFQKAIQAAGNDPIVIEQAANYYQRT